LTAEVEVHVVVLLRAKVLSHVHDAAAAVVEHVEVQYTAASAQLLGFVLAEGSSRSEVGGSCQIALFLDMFLTDNMKVQRKLVLEFGSHASLCDACDSFVSHFLLF